MTTDPQDNPPAAPADAPTSVAPSPHPRRGPITPADKARIIQMVRAGGRRAGFAWWARGEANPTDGRPRARRTLMEALERDAQFRTAFEEADRENADVAVSRALSEVEKIAFGTGSVTESFDKDGALRSRRTDVREKLHALLQILRARDPETWTPRKRLDGTVEHGGTVQHQHSLAPPSGSQFTVRIEDVQRLPPAKADALFALLDELAGMRALPQAREVADEPR